MKNLYALIIGIDEYDGCTNLNGCVNDANHFYQFLKENCNSQKLDLQSIFLTDKQATRKAIIAGFSHFDQAKEGDICLFFYAGHGSQVLAPKELQHLEASEFIETIICHDSRGENGRDLVDKELAYLVWKATHQKKIHFTAIMDCCHAGSGLRDEFIGHRRMSIKGRSNRIEDYLGVEHYKKIEKDGEQQYYPPRGTYIQLAASRNNQTAKELVMDRQTRGNFTYNLIKVLKENESQMTYQDLMKEVAAQMALRIREQHPQVDTTNPDMALEGFLGGALRPKPKHYNLRLDLSTMNWILDAGSIQGIRPTGKGEGTWLTLEDGNDIKVRSVLPNSAIVQGMDGYNGRVLHKAFIKQLGAPPLSIGFAQGVAEEHKNQLLNTAKDQESTLVSLGVPLAEARCWLWLEDKHWWLTYPSEKDQPIFPKVPSDFQWANIDILNKCDKLAKWIQLLELNNPQTTLRQNSIKVDLFKINEPCDPDMLEDSAAADIIPSDGSIPFSYGPNGELPAFRLRITNTGLETVWVSALYMDELLGINNYLLPKQELKAGQVAWMLDVLEDKRANKRYEYKSIPIEISTPEATSTQSFIKIIISTDELDTNDFKQQPIPLNVTSEPHRSTRRRVIVAKPDWMARVVMLRIEK